MSIRLASLLALAVSSVVALPVVAQQPAGRPEDTEVWTPVPKVVTPGRSSDAPPSDAIVLFDGKDLSHWQLAGKRVFMIGTAALRSACRMKTDFSEMPLARAVRM